MPTFKRGQQLTDGSLLRPRLAHPTLLLDDGDEIHESPPAHEIMHKVLTRTHPYLGLHGQIEASHPLGGDQTPIRNTPGELRALALSCESAPTHRRVDSVRAYQSVDRDPPAIIEARLNMIATIEYIRQPMSDMQAVSREAAQKSLHQIGAVCLIVRSTTGVLHCGPQVAYSVTYAHRPNGAAASANGFTPCVSDSSVIPSRCRIREGLG